MAKKAYCPSCGEMVEIFVTLSEGNEHPHCVQCGLILSQQAQQKSTQLGTVVLADDSPSLRTVVTEFLKSKGLAREVIPTEDGKQFLAIVTEMLKQQKAVHLAILDVNMPVLDGINAAKTLRAVEEGMRTGKKIPILFFSVVKADEHMRQLLNFVKPAAYLNKGKSSSPSELAERLTQILSKLIKSS